MTATTGETDIEVYPPYQLPPEAGYDWPPVQWMPPLYTHQIDYDDLFGDPGPTPRPDPQD
jgi:hypothetical protein